MTSPRTALAALLIAVATLAGCSATSDTGSRTIATPVKTTAPAATTDAALAAAEAKFNDAVASADALASAQAAAGPTKADYTITIKTLTKHCFGSAGCNVDARLTVAGNPVTSGVPVELTVSVTGDEDGPQTETIVLDEDGKYEAPEVSLSTKSSKTKVKATITAIEVTS